MKIGTHTIILSFSVKAVSTEKSNHQILLDSKKIHYDFRLIEEEFIFLPKIINLPQQL